MGIRIKLKLSFTLFILVMQTVATAQGDEYCKEYLDFQMSHAKETLLKESIDRVHKKLELAFLSAYSKSKGIRLSNNDEFIRLSDALRTYDKDFSDFLDKHFQYRFFKTFYKKRFTPEKELSIHDLVYRWQKFQKSNPEYFEDLSRDALLDEWDIFAADSITQMNSLNLETKPDYTKVINNFSNPENLVDSYTDFDENFEAAKKDFKENELRLDSNFKTIISDSLTNYEDVCPKGPKLEEGVLACLEKQSDSSFYLKKNFMKDLALVFENVELGQAEPKSITSPTINISKEPSSDDPFSDLEIEKPNYKTNDGIATFCKRDPSVANTIVIHHTATNFTESAESLNDMHLQRKTAGEHWYMLGYNYLVKQDNYGSQNVKLIQGRPLDMSGSHAGGSIKPDAETLKLIKSTDVSCGSYKDGFTTEKLSSKIIKGKINANHTTIGISVIGNYAPKQYVRRGGVVLVENETGYEPKGPKRLPSDAILKQTAKLACSLQKKYPRLKYIKPHQFFKQTECPGSVKEKLDKIIKYAKEYSCDFLP